MDYREIMESNDSVIIKGVKNFNIKQILECGQCFRWQRVTDTDYIVVSNRRVIEIIQEDDEVIIHNTNMNDFKNIWENYFDLNTEYGPLKEELSNDELLKQASIAETIYSASCLLILLLPSLKPSTYIGTIGVFSGEILSSRSGIILLS